MTSKRHDEIFPGRGDIGRAAREARLGQKGLTVWMTGLSASGKSTTAYALEKYLTEQGHFCYVLDGDNLRCGINANLDFSPPARKENIRRVAEIAYLMNDAGLIAICSLISPLAEDRDMARRIIGKEHFFEVYLNTPLEVCEARDSKQLYSKARKGLIPDFTGISAPYQAPPSPDFIVNTSHIEPGIIGMSIADQIQARIVNEPMTE
ncbi:MAG: adenylyl-sulfate kinase [Azoarcus sp.]|jgi:adenylyl-sulfate kinase|nr:adenylyl-sulfate kinase [Azoarcus sp.]